MLQFQGPFNFVLIISSDTKEELDDWMTKNLIDKEGKPIPNLGIKNDTLLLLTILELDRNKIDYKTLSESFNSFKKEPLHNVRGKIKSFNQPKGERK